LRTTGRCQAACRSRIRSSPGDRALGHTCSHQRQNRRQRNPRPDPCTLSAVKPRKRPLPSAESLVRASAVLEKARAWQQFAAALGMLAFALASALYSSSVARQGRIMGAGISAIVALAIAVWVAVRFVPRLASNVDWFWIPALAQYHVT